MDDENLQWSKRELGLKTVENPAALLLQQSAEPAVHPLEALGRDGIRPLRQCENNCELLRWHDSAAAPYYRDNIAEFAELSLCYGHLLRQGDSVPLGVRYFGADIGYGLITLLDLQKDDFIGQYTGIIQVSDGGLARENSRGYSSDYSWDYPHFPDDWPDIEISAENAGNALRYANHSFGPNCRVEHTLLDGLWRLFFLADKNIAAGGQLLVNYGEDYWSGGLRELVHI